MKNKLLTSILAGTFLLSGCSRFIKKESVTIPNGYSPIFIQTLKSLRNGEDYVFGKAYASADDLDKQRKSKEIVDAWGRVAEKQPVSQEEYQRNCLENARKNAFSEIIGQINPNSKTKKSSFIMIDMVIASDEEGKKCYYEGAIGRESLKLLKARKKK